MKFVGYMYCVYEVSSQHRHGKRLKVYKSQERAENFCNKSVFRFMKAAPVYK